MRKRFFSIELKKCFSIAWHCLPINTQKDFSKFIRQIREVKSLEGTYIGCPDGTRFGPIEDGVGYTFLYKDEELIFCDVLLSSSIIEISQAHAIGTILHELAHVLEYFISPIDAANSPIYNAEANAWEKAIIWAKAGISDTQLVQEIEFLALEEILEIGLVELSSRIENKDL